MNEENRILKRVLIIPSQTAEEAQRTINNHLEYQSADQIFEYELLIENSISIQKSAFTTETIVYYTVVINEYGML